MQSIKSILMPETDIPIEKPTREVPITPELRAQIDMPNNAYGQYFAPEDESNPYQGNHVIIYTPAEDYAKSDIFEKVSNRLRESKYRNEKDKVLATRLASELDKKDEEFQTSWQWRAVLDLVNRNHERNHRIQEIRYGTEDLYKKAHNSSNFYEARTNAIEMRAFLEAQCYIAELGTAGLTQHQKNRLTQLALAGSLVAFNIMGNSLEKETNLKELYLQITEDQAYSDLIIPQLEYLLAKLVMLTGNVYLMDQVASGELNSKALHNVIRSAVETLITNPALIYDRITQRDFQLAVDKKIQESAQKINQMVS